jgi:thermolysin
MSKFNFLVLLLIGVILLASIFLVGRRAEGHVAVFGTGNEVELKLAVSKSLDVIRERFPRELVGNVDDFVVKSNEIDSQGYAHTKFQQRIGTVPVWEGEVIVHHKPDGELFALTDSLRPIDPIDTFPTLKQSDAVKIAKKIYAGSRHLTEPPVADLWIYHGGEASRLAFRVSMKRIDGTHETTMPVIFIDAHTGEKLLQYDNFQTGTGSSLYSGNVVIGTTRNGSTFFMENLTRANNRPKHGTFNYNNTTTTMSRVSDTDDIWDTTINRAAVDAQYGAESTLDYFRFVHGRNGINGTGGPGYTTAIDGTSPLITSAVHYSTNYNNAGWNGSFMLYGDGDGSTFGPLVTIDIAGHELTHGVTEFTANLTYLNESGALNESMSDVFGTMVNRYAKPTSWNWQIGEECYTPANGTGDALRFLNTPHSAANSGFTADDDPDHYNERYTGSSDNGGVHINSGIANNAFYLLAQGGTHHLSGVTVTGIGPDKAEQIWFKALSAYMTASTNFAGARTASISAATQLFGSTSPENIAVQKAWCAVGVGTCPAGTTPTPTPNGTELITNGAFETAIAPWVMSGSGAIYTNAGNFPHGGTGYAYFGAAVSVNGQAYQTITIPAGKSPTLTFWLNVTSQETTTTIQYDKLFVEVLDNSGTLLTTLATYSNLNKVTASNDYSQKSFSLAPYAGQTIRVQFRSTNDSSSITTFRLDDASAVYF